MFTKKEIRLASLQILCADDSAPIAVMLLAKVGDIPEKVEQGDLAPKEVPNLFLQAAKELASLVLHGDIS